MFCLKNKLHNTRARGQVSIYYDKFLFLQDITTAMNIQDGSLRSQTTRVRIGYDNVN